MMKKYTTKKNAAILRRPWSKVLCCAAVLSSFSLVQAEEVNLDTTAKLATGNEAKVSVDATSSITLENRFLKRQISLKPSIHTSELNNRLDNKSLKPFKAEAFIIYLNDEEKIPASAFAIGQVTPSESTGDAAVSIELECNQPAIKATLVYTLGSEDFFTRKTLSIKPAKDLLVEKIDLESMQLKEAYQPYQISKITANAPRQWKPGLGQPLYTKTTGTFWGVEFPASVNSAKDGQLTCSYSYGKTIKAGETYTSHAAVIGGSDSADFVKEAFFDYIDRTRIRPLRLQTQYNSWFDFGTGVSAENFSKSVAKTHNELHNVRGVPPLKAYVIDAGWENRSADWSTTVWQVNGKFKPDFSDSCKAVADAKSHLGLWLSPGCLFGTEKAIPKMKAAGFRSLAPWMSMAHPAYMDKLEERMVELSRQGVTYFKLDGVFGHLNVRNFDVEGFNGNETELNDPKYDVRKIHYLSEGTERLIQLFSTLHQEDPEIYIVISNGAWLSPWWLQHIDSVWMINAGDAAGGSNRTEELVYRDSVYHDLAVSENTQFPLHSIFNHEPKKTESRENKATFRNYLYMNMSRGTGFIELYIKPFVLKDYDWDVLAEGLLWAHEMFPTFQYSKMHGGAPQKREVYGYTAWNTEGGYVSIHNPSHETQSYSFKIDRVLGLQPESMSSSFYLSSPIEGNTDGLNESYSYGSTITLDLKPGEIRILNFDLEKRDWKMLKALQTRTEADFHAPEPIPLKGHAILGVWQYGEHTREFKEDGKCTLKSNGVVQWTKDFVATSATHVVIENRYHHNIRKDGSLDIEGRYKATKKE